MSFVRVGRSQHSHGKRPVRSKKTSAPKEWVSTVNDLSVHKLTPEELSRRHEMHRSQNRAVAQWELRERALRRRSKHTHPASPAPLDRTSLNIIREVFSDQFQLHDVLARSDRAMAVIKDLFGDAPRRQTGFPSVTMAPDCGSDSELPVLQRPEPPTQLSLLSQSMMDPQALNELEGSEEEGHSDEETGPSASVSFNSNLDAHRGHSQKAKAKAKPKGRGTQQQRPQSNSDHQGAGDTPPQTPCASGGAHDHAALNATVAVQRVRSRQTRLEREEPSTLVAQVLNPDPPLTRSGRKMRSSKATRGRSESSGLDGSAVSSLSGNQSSLELLQGMLGQVESELDSLGPEEPTRAPGPTGPQHSTHGLTGFSVALVSTLGRLARLLRQREEESQREARERGRLEEEVREQRRLIDALTSETMTLREESAALQTGLQQHAFELEQRLDTVILALGGLGVLGAHRDYLPQGTEGVPATGWLGGGSHAETDPQEKAPVNPAVLLSPPRQRDSRPAPHTSVVGSLHLHQEASLPGTRSSCDDLQTLSSAPSLSSLPCTTPTPLDLAPDPTLSEPSQDAMLSQIAELTRQNALIRGQLGQFKGQGSSRGSPRNSTERRGSSSSSTGRGTPQTGPERRVSAPSSTGRATPQSDVERERGPFPSTGEQLPQQAVVSDGSSVSSVEQRLLELNRQSAAARSRLLELIEQQKQSTSGRVSPSVSPIPPHSTSTASEVSMLLPEQDLSPQGSEGGRRSAGGVSPQSFGEASAVRRTQVDKLKGGGWFALSTHVR